MKRNSLETSSAWKQVRAKQVETKAEEAKVASETTYREEVNKKLLQRLLKLANEPKSKSAVQAVRQSLNGFDNFEAFERAVEQLDQKDPVQRSFSSEFKKVFTVKNPAKKYLNWCNYTVYTRASLITAVFAKWFGDKPTRPTVQKTVKKKVPISAGKTPTGKISHRKLFKTVVRKLMTTMSNTQYQIHQLKSQRMMMDPRVTAKEQHLKYGILRTYAYKLFTMLVDVDDETGEKHRVRRQSSYTQKVADQSRIASLAKRRERLMVAKTGCNMDWLQSLLQEKKQYYPFATASSPEDVQKQMTLLREVCKTQTMQKLIAEAQSGHEPSQRMLCKNILQRYPKRLAKNGF